MLVILLKFRILLIDILENWNFWMRLLNIKNILVFVKDFFGYVFGFEIIVIWFK